VVRGTDLAAHAVRVARVALDTGGHVLAYPEGRGGGGPPRGPPPATLIRPGGQPPRYGTASRISTLADRPFGSV
jgi:hypothetical protein